MENLNARLLVLKSQFEQMDESESELFYNHPECEMIGEIIHVEGFIDTPLALGMAKYNAFLILDKGFGDAYREFTHTHNEFVKDSVTYKYFEELFLAAYSGADLLMAMATLDKMLITSINAEMVMMDKLDVFAEMWESSCEYYKDLEDMSDMALFLLNMD